MSWTAINTESKKKKVKKESEKLIQTQEHIQCMSYIHIHTHTLHTVK